MTESWSSSLRRRCTVGVELELQILNSRDYNLARDAADLIGLLEKKGLPARSSPRSPRA